MFLRPLNQNNKRQLSSLLKFSLIDAPRTRETKGVAEGEIERASERERERERASERARERERASERERERERGRERERR